MAAELALRWWRTQFKSDPGSAISRSFASVVTLSGPLLSYPTLPQDARCPTSLMFFHWNKDSQVTGDDIKALGKGFTIVKDIEMAGEGGMPRSRDEWYPIMKFWSQVLGRRGMINAYEIFNP